MINNSQLIAFILMLSVCSPIFSQNESIDVLIIGAGVAGITAAQQLQEQGLSVRIIEARDHIGGRVWTDYSQAQPFELGAGWIQGSEKNPLTSLSEKFHIKTQDYDFDNSVVYNAKGKRLSEKNVNYIDKLGSQFMDYLSIRQEKDENDTSVKAAYHDYLNQKNLNKQDAQWLYYDLIASIQYEYAGDLSELSMMEFDQDSSFLGKDLVFPKGYSQLIQALAQGLHIQLNERVQSVDYQKLPIVVTTNLGQYRARYVLCTVSSGVLQKGVISFHPELPKTKKQALTQLGMGTLDRVYLQFPSVFWDKDVDEINYIPQKSARWLEIINLFKINKNPALMAFVSGHQAEEMEKESDTKVVNELMAHLQLIYGDQTPRPNHYKITHWYSDPYSYGSYSFIKVNGNGEAYKVLAKPINHRLFFAGEATNAQFPASVHGAYLSGLRAAKEIAAEQNNRSSVYYN